VNAVKSWTPTEVGKMGCTYGGLSGKDKDDFGKGDALYVTFLGVLGNTAVGVEDTSQVRIGAHEKQNPVLKGDLLFNGTSETPGELAMGAVVRDDISNLFLNSFCFGLRLHDPIQHHAPFLAYLSRGEPGRAATRALAQGATRYNISKSQFRRITFAIPTPQEQHGIAEALSDVDRVLGSLDALIAKKRLVRHATMQQLLTGRTRLSGFHEEWVKKALRDVALPQRAQTNPSSAADSVFDHYSLPAFDAGRRPVPERGHTIGSNKFLIPDGAVLVSRLNPRIPRVWVPFSSDNVRIASTEFLVLTPRLEVSQGFLATICASPAFCKQMEAAVTGTTRSHQRVHPADAMGFEVRVPTDGREQRAVTTVDRDMETEITALERRRDKTLAIKWGMMQQLLTGRTRLIEPQATGGKATAS